MTGIPVDAQEPVEVILDGRTLRFDVNPTIIDDRVMVPMRVIFEELGANVTWNENNRSITATRGTTLVIAVVGNRTISVNGRRNEMDVAPLIIDGRTLVPIRFVSEALGANVEWHGETRTVLINSLTGKRDQISTQDFTPLDTTLESFTGDDEWDDWVLDDWYWIEWPSI